MSRVGKKRQNERWDQGVSIDAVKRSSQLCRRATTSSPAITLSFQSEALRGGASAASSQRGTNPILNLIHKIVHESVAQSKREKLKKRIFKHI